MNSHNVWQVFVQDRIYEAEYEELIQWIREGSVLPEDKVRRGNLRWLNVGKIQEFNRYFQEQRETDKSKLTVVTANLPNAQGFAASQFTSSAQTQPFDAGDKNVNEAKLPICSIHSERPYSYVCEICESYFCKTCPNNFGSSVKICINCGGLCVSSEEFEQRGSKIVGAINKPYPRADIQQNVNDEKSAARLRLADFLEAFKHPFRFPISLIICSMLFAVMLVGQLILTVGNWLLFALSLLFTVLTLVFLFSVMFKTIENAQQEKPKARYFAGLSRYTLWEDFFHPFLLGIGVYFVTFGLFTITTVGAGAYALYTFNEDLEKIKSETRSSIGNVDFALKSIQSNYETRPINQNEIEEKVNHTLQKQFEAVFGSNYLADTTQLEKVFKSFMRFSIIFQMPIFFAFIFGVIFFPAIAIVSSTTRSFSKTLNLFFGLKTIKKCGFDYIKINFLTMIFLTTLVLSAISVYQIFSSCDKPLLGILLSSISTGVLFFYFWLAFSNILGTVFRRRKIAFDA